MHVKQKFGFELKRLVNQREDTMKIGAWAYDFWYAHLEELDSDFFTVLTDMCSMEMGPEFVYSYESLNKIADDHILDKKKNSNVNDTLTVFDDESKMKMDDLTKILRDDVKYLYQIKWDGYLKSNIKIEIVPKNIRSILLAYLKNTITAANLVDWAAFIWKHRKSYFINVNSNEKSDYDEMWNIVFNLAMQEDIDKINPALVRNYNIAMNKYFQKRIIKLKLEDLAWILSGCIDDLDRVEIFDEYDSGLNLVVVPESFKLVLRKYLDRNITDENLSKWSKFVMRYYDEYCTKYFTEYVNDESYKEMWIMIRELSVLKNSEIIPEKALEYLSKL